MRNFQDDLRYVSQRLANDVSRRLVRRRLATSRKVDIKMRHFRKTIFVVVRFLDQNDSFDNEVEKCSGS